VVVRKKTVVINGQFSSWRDVLSGVPQGSVLGPMLFVIYINDIDELIGCSILKFADDTKIFQEIKSPQDIARLQEDQSILLHGRMIGTCYLTLTNARSCTWDIIIRVLNTFLMEQSWKM